MKRTPLQRKTPIRSGRTRRKRCPSCRVMFTPARDGQAVCGEIECAIAHGQSDKGQATARKALADFGRREIEVRKEKLKTRTDHLKDAEKAVRDYRRMYELSIGSGCISCGESQESIIAAQGWKTGGAFDAGHFLGKGADRSCGWCRTTSGCSARAAMPAHPSSPERARRFRKDSGRG